jgi:hypothetical protein
MKMLMKTDYLLPHVFKKIGWCVFVPSALFLLFGHGMLSFWDDNLISFPTIILAGGGILGPLNFLKIQNTGMLNEILFCMALIGAYMICFSKRTVEDEFIQYLRTKSLVWALKLNTILLILYTWFFFGVVYYNLILVSTFSIFILFECRFQNELYKMRRKNKE